METLKQSIYRHLISGKNRNAAIKAGFVDCCYGRATYLFNILDNAPTQAKHGIMNNICRSCRTPVEEDDLFVSSAYWTPHAFQVWHKECHTYGHKLEVIEHQKIDMDCNECCNFDAKTHTDKYGDRAGFCKLNGIETIAHPGGVYCNYPSHDECFKHRLDK